MNIKCIVDTCIFIDWPKGASLHARLFACQQAINLWSADLWLCGTSLSLHPVVSLGSMSPHRVPKVPKRPQTSIGPLRGGGDVTPLRTTWLLCVEQFRLVDHGSRKSYEEVTSCVPSVRISLIFVLSQSWASNDLNESCDKTPILPVCEYLLIIITRGHFHLVAM